MRLVVDLAAVLAVFPAAWLGFILLKVSVLPPSFCALMFSIVVGVLCLRLWSPGQPLFEADIKDVGLMLLVWPFVTALSLFGDALVAHVNLLDMQQWPDLWRSGSIFGFVLTVAVAAGFPPVAMATLIRMGLRRLLGRLDADPLVELSGAE